MTPPVTNTTEAAKQAAIDPALSPISISLSSPDRAFA
jgi:hypothetical protein